MALPSVASTSVFARLHAGVSGHKKSCVFWVLTQRKVHLLGLLVP
jgi:hypothetical protein